MTSDHLGLHLLAGSYLATAAILLAAGCASQGGDTSAPPPAQLAHPVGSPPLCEPSAAERAPWDQNVILVVDDDVRDRLFAFDLGADGLLTGQRSLPLLSGEGPDDLEALALANGRVIAFGSHGRSARCERQPETERLELLSWDDSEIGLRRVRQVDSTDRMDRATKSRSSCLEGLFVSPAPAYAAEVCDAIVEAEVALDPDHCIPPFDIEGAASLVSGESGDSGRTWIGFRRPRVDGAAVLLRLVAGLEELRFDGVCLIPVGDRGIRGLTSHRDSLWVILGPAAPGWDSSALWTAPATAIAPGAIADGRLAADDLPPSSEALILADTFALVLTDGSGGPVPGRCRRQPTQVRVPLEPNAH